jgi:hypothetical protein
LPHLSLQRGILAAGNMRVKKIVPRSSLYARH